MRKQLKIAVWVLAGTLGLLLAVYLGFAVYFRSHYLFHTTIGDYPCGGKTAQAAEKHNENLAADYLLTVYDRNAQKAHLRGMDFSYQYVPTGEEKRILESQNAFSWPTSLFRSYEYPLTASVSYDTEELAAQIDALPVFSEENIVPPADARIEITDKGYEVVPEVPGSTPIRDVVAAKITEALDREETEVWLLDDCYVAPAVCASDPSITETAAQLDHYMNAQIHYEIDGADENLTSERILSMLDIGEDGTVSVNADKVAQYVQTLASTYNTFGDVRRFTTSKGDTVEIGGGDYGWVINKPKEAEQIIADLNGGQPVSREPVYEQTAVQSGLDDIGDTYVEIDYTGQHLWFYKEGTLIVESDIVSGNMSRGNGSPDGVFKIVYKERDATLVGEDYNTPVSYFMPYCYNIGIHDAGWRPAFGGSIYMTGGSHGCVNVPPDTAKTIFENIDKGTPVVAYYREPVELKSESARISNAYSYVEPED